MDIDKRFERILAIYIQLQSKPVVKAQDLADRFQVSLRTIYRDIKSLEKAGVPIYSEAGYGYSLALGYKLPPALFTKDEALSFAVAEKLMQQYLDKDLSQQFSNALSKMKAILRTNDKEKIQLIEPQLQLTPKREMFNTSVPSALSILFESIASKMQVNLQYLKSNSQQVEQRVVEPIGVFQEHGYWYFMAYCQLREDVRQFRLDRLSDISLLDIPFKQKLQSLSFYLKEKLNKKPNLAIAKIWVTKRMQQYMRWERKLYGFVEEEESEGGYLLTFEYDKQYQYLMRWLLSFADEIKIVSPKALKNELVNILDKIKAQHST